MRSVAAIVALLAAPFAHGAAVLSEDAPARDVFVRLPATLLVDPKPAVAWIAPPRPRAQVSWGSARDPKQRIIPPKPVYAVEPAEIEEKPPEPRPIEGRTIVENLREMPEQAAYLWIAGLMIGSSLLWRTIWHPWAADADPRTYAR